jgi:hypothetical protein
LHLEKTPDGLRRRRRQNHPNEDAKDIQREVTSRSD